MHIAHTNQNVSLTPTSNGLLHKGGIYALGGRRGREKGGGEEKRGRERGEKREGRGLNYLVEFFEGRAKGSATHEIGTRRHQGGHTRTQGTSKVVRLKGKTKGEGSSAGGGGGS